MSPALLANADAPSALSAVRFVLTADAEPGLLPRLLQPFAKRDLVPDRLSSRRAGDAIEVEILMDAMPAELVHLVEGNLRQVVGVRRLARIGRAALRRLVTPPKPRSDQRAARAHADPAPRC